MNKELAKEIAKKYSLDSESRKSLNRRQIEVFTNIYWCAKNIIGSYENSMSDNGYAEGDLGYGAYQELKDLAGLHQTIKECAGQCIYRDGFEGMVSNDYLKHYRFVGNEFIDKCIRCRLEIEYRANGVAGWVLDKNIEWYEY